MGITQGQNELLMSLKSTLEKGMNVANYADRMNILIQAEEEQMMKDIRSFDLAVRN